MRPYAPVLLPLVLLSCFVAITFSLTASEEAACLEIRARIFCKEEGVWRIIGHPSDVPSAPVRSLVPSPSTTSDLDVSSVLDTASPSSSPRAVRVPNSSSVGTTGDVRAPLEPVSTTVSSGLVNLRRDFDREATDEPNGPGHHFNGENCMLFRSHHVFSHLDS